MGQIVFNNQKPKYCNLIAIQAGGLHVNDSVALNEIWLVDTTNSSKSSSGTGKYDAYIVGDGVKTAGQLASTDLRYIDTPVDMSKYSSTEEMMYAIHNEINNLSIPTSLSQLEGDSMHRTVTDEDIAKWNLNTGEGDIINNPDNEDIASVEISGINVLKFKDKAFDETAFSGYGKVHLRKNIVNEVEKEKVNLSINGVPDHEIPGDIIIDPETGDPVLDEETGEPKREASTFTPATINDAVAMVQASEEHIAARITHAYWDLRASVGGKAVLHDRSTTNESSIAGYWSVGYIVTPVTAGEICNVTANFKSDTANASGGYFWAIIDNVNDKNILQCDETASDNNEAVSSFIEVEHTGWLVVNHISYLNPPYSIVLYEGSGIQKDYNIVTFPNSQKTIFIIQYDYDLNGRSINLPENSVLKFEGGSLKNATIKGNDTLIVAEETYNIFGRNTELVGTWRNDNWYPKWFGAYQDGETDDTDILQKMMNLAPVIGKRIHLRLGSYTYRTTRGLILKDNVYLYGGTINAKFDDPLDWVIQTEALYNYQLTSYRSFGGWNAYDSGVLKHCSGYIEGTTINGELNKHIVNGEWDGTYCPIFGGVRMQAGILPTKGLRINKVGYGFARACSLNSYDKDMIIHAYFRAYTARDVNNVTVYDTYFTANSHYQKSSPTDTKEVIPYYSEYHGLTPAGSWIAGDGGYDDLDPEHERPKYTLVSLSYAWMSFINFTTDGWSEVAFGVGENSQVCVQNAWFEAVVKAYLYTGGYNTKTTFINTHAHSSPEYDIYCGPKSGTDIYLIKSGVNCSGYGDSEATAHKFQFARYYEPNINVLDTKTSDYPNLSFWHFLEGNDVYVNIVGNELTSRYQNNTNWNFESNGKYSTVYYAILGSGKYYNVPANTTAGYSGGSKTISKELVFKGESKTTSKLTLSDVIIFNNCNITFSNLTLYITQFKTNNSKFTFRNCIIVGFRDYNRTISKNADYYFEGCTFISIPYYKSGTRLLGFGEGRVTISNCTFNPYVRYNHGLDNKDYLTDITYNYSSGTTEMRNLISWHAAAGEEFFNTDTNRKEYWNGRLWGDADGYPYTVLRGTTGERPALPAMKIGTQYSDTTMDSIYELISNGTCGYGLFNFNVKIPKVTRNIYIGRTLVEPVDGDFTVNLPVGTYPVYCNGYECSPAEVTIAANTSSLSIKTKASIYSTTYNVDVYAVDGSGNYIDNLTVIVGGGNVATRTTRKVNGVTVPCYNVKLPNGTYQAYSTEYEEYGTVIVNGRDTSVTVTMETAVVTPAETIALTGSVYSMDSLENANGDVIQAGTFTASVDELSVNVNITADDLSLILYSIDYTEAELNQQFAYLLMRKWFEAGHYAEYSNGAKLYNDKVGILTGNSATYTDDENNPTNLVCTASYVAGTDSVWQQAAGGSSSNMEVVAASGTTLSVDTGKYYRFDSAVNSLAITLPSQTASTVAKAVIINFTTGNDPTITITAADGKSVVYFDNYDISAGHTYELNCMYNGVKWIVGTSLINESVSI